jgi:hypothetical protein
MPVARAPFTLSAEGHLIKMGRSAKVTRTVGLR